MRGEDFSKIKGPGGREISNLGRGRGKSQTMEGVARGSRREGFKNKNRGTRVAESPPPMPLYQK